MVVIGIDPGLATVGVGIVEAGLRPERRLHVLDYCTIETAKGLSAAERLMEIAADLSSIIRKNAPDLAVVEKLYFATNRKTAMEVSEARGVILLTVGEAGMPIIEPTPLELKVAVTGDGQADKRQMRDMLARTLGLNLAGVTDDAVDALGLAVYGALHQGKRSGTPEKLLTAILSGTVRAGGQRYRKRLSGASRCL